MQDSSDRALVGKTREGEGAAYGELVRRYQSSVFNVCYRLLGERREAEDLAQESFVRGYQRLQTFDAGRPFGPWIRRLAANLCLNRLRQLGQERWPLDEDHGQLRDDAQANPETAEEKRESSEQVREAIMSLPPRYRVVVELRHFQGLTYYEISRTLGLPLSDVKSHLFRARKMLARRLRPDD
jgi:RNA polymerase sigma-70 factor (ECF subfamily)